MTRMQESLGKEGRRCAYEVEYRAPTQGTPTRGTITWLSEEGMRVTSPGTAPVEPGEILQLRFWVDASLRRKVGRVVHVDGGTFSVAFDLSGYVATQSDLPPVPETRPAAEAKPKPQPEAPQPRPIAPPPVSRPPEPARQTMPRLGGTSLSERWISRRTATHL